MSKYTTEVRYICEDFAGYEESQGYNKVESILTVAAPKVFNFSFPIFDESYRLPLERKILRHYYTREICAETVGLWQLWLDAKMNDIMPYYNKLYESELLKFNPLWDVDIVTKRDDKFESKSKGSNESDFTTKNEGDDWSLFSDTPQGGLNGVKSNDYLTTANNEQTNNSSRTSGDGSSTGEVNSVDDWIEHKYGRNGGYTVAKALKEFRETLLNIDMMIIKDLEPLFFNLW